MVRAGWDGWLRAWSGSTRQVGCKSLPGTSPLCHWHICPDSASAAAAGLKFRSSFQVGEALLGPRGVEMLKEPLQPPSAQHSPWERWGERLRGASLAASQRST